MHGAPWSPCKVMYGASEADFVQILSVSARSQALLVQQLDIEQNHSMAQTTAKSYQGQDGHEKASPHTSLLICEALYYSA